MATKKTNQTETSKLLLTAKIDRMIEREDATVKAYASVNIGGAFVIKDIAVVDGQKGMFARMPFRSYKTGSGETKYSDIAFALTDEARHSPILPRIERFNRPAPLFRRTDPLLQRLCQEASRIYAGGHLRR